MIDNVYPEHLDEILHIVRELRRMRMQTLFITEWILHFLRTYFYICD
jgi:hypothetical protein